MDFFDQFERFYTTSQTSPFPHRLNGRHEAIIARNADKLAGKRILDIGSHDGRWAFAALKAGAAHVVGVEPRMELVENARKTFTHYRIDAARYEFIQGDAFEFLGQEGAASTWYCAWASTTTPCGTLSCSTELNEPGRISW